MHRDLGRTVERLVDDQAAADTRHADVLKVGVGLVTAVSSQIAAPALASGHLAGWQRLLLALLALAGLLGIAEVLRRDDLLVPDVGLFLAWCAARGIDGSDADLLDTERRLVKQACASVNASQLASMRAASRVAIAINLVVAALALVLLVRAEA